VVPLQAQVPDDARIFSELYPSLRRFAAVVGPIEVDPDDLLQEAIARRLRRGLLCDLDDPGAYLRRAMVNLAANQRRHFAVRRRALARLAASGPDRGLGDDYPSDIADLLRLPAAQRAVLYLSEVEGLRYAEIGDLLGCTEAAARKRAMKGRRRLHAALVGEVPGG
jgi:DNA-directed RNA polymerase specialized sigma24 family protein